VQRRAWAIALPPMLGGILLAHALAFELTVPAAERASALSETGHSWFAYLPLLLGAAAALLALGLVRRVLTLDDARPPVWPFALFPPLALFLQEQLERGRLAFDPTIAAGVLLAVPLGLVAYALLRTLLHVSDRLAVALRMPPAFRFEVPACLVRPGGLLPAANRPAPLGARGPPGRART
jgi:hypothetical protein